MSLETSPGLEKADNLAPHQRRVIQEIQELAARAGKLDAYVKNGCPGATRPEAELLSRQLIVMRQYEDILLARSALWNAE